MWSKCIKPEMKTNLFALAMNLLIQASCLSCTTAMRGASAYKYVYNNGYVMDKQQKVVGYYANGYVLDKDRTVCGYYANGYIYDKNREIIATYSNGYVKDAK